ncbi:hypothetical protein FACS189421_07370 [Bacteroidia bacterium]|nr:hypothetical protein FACS189421_07370 [Bacteroidia bacterium]
MGWRVKPAMTGLIFIIFLSSCASTHQMTIEVQEPANITFPADINTLLVVNNAAKQPGHSGITRTYNGTVVKDPELDLDSAAWISTFSLLSRIKETQFFEEVSLCAEALREDDEWLVAAPLSKKFREEIFETQDGIISIDRLLINLDELVTANDIKQSAGVRVEAKLTCSIYVYDREKPLTAFTVSDTLVFSEIFYENKDSVGVLKYLPEYLIDELAYSIGEKLAYYFTPSWTLKDRTLYSGSNARLQEAFSFARAGKWDRAETVWKNEYDQKSKPSDQGKLANNIAVANEMQDKLEIALQWALSAKENFKAGSSNITAGELLQINTYVNDLQKRIQDNPLLDLQWGERN